jgi:cytochrome o ubiquinol oxidase subunit 1
MKQHSAKQTDKPVYRPIHETKNTPAGLFIASFAFIFGFAMIWHIWWLAILGLACVIITLIIRTTSDSDEDIISVAEIERIEGEAAQGQYV